MTIPNGTYVLATYAPSRWVALQLSADVHDVEHIGPGAPFAGAKGYAERRAARDKLLGDLRAFVQNPHARVRNTRGDSLFAHLFAAATRRDAVEHIEGLLHVPWNSERDVCVEVLRLSREERASFRVAMMTSGEVCPECGQRVRR
jgi:hypothetical protein